MSYILDALRRAEAERERGAVPNLNAQPYAAPDGDTDGESRRSAPAWLWIVLGVLLAAVLLLGWRLLAGNAPPEPARVITAAPPEPVATTPEPGASSAATSSAVAPAPAPAMAAQTPAAAPPTKTNPAPTHTDAAPPEPPPARAASTKPPSRAERKASPPATAAEKAAPPAAAPATATAPAPAPAPAAGVTAERIYSIAELPDDVRRSLPALPIGGAMYSRKPADRMLIVNGQVFHEGDAITPELKLEQIRLKSAVLRFRSYQYEITY